MLLTKLPEWEDYERKVISQIDGHYCADWDELAVSAWTPEYDCCVCFKKTWLGRIVNWLYMHWFNFRWWWYVGRKRRKDLTDL